MNEKDFFVHESSYIDDNVKIGKGTKIWYFSHVQEGAEIGKNCTLGQNVNIGNNVKIGNNCKIQNNVSVYEGVKLEDHVFCGPSMVFTNVLKPRAKHPVSDTDEYKKTLVKEGASLGANATIVCGNKIGKHSFIGAGSVVTEDVPDYSLMVGVPAKREGWMCECGDILSSSEKEVSCSNCGGTYILKNDLLVKKE